MIVVDDLWFSYPGSSHSLFQGLSLRVATCSWVVLTGPDGAGKTTLGRLIAGVYQPTRGKIRIEPTDVGSGCAVGYVGSDPYDYLVGTTVEEDVTFGLENLGLSSTEITVRLKQALAWTGLQGMEQRLTHSLSGGGATKTRPGIYARHECSRPYTGRGIVYGGS